MFVSVFVAVAKEKTVRIGAKTNRLPWHSDGFVPTDPDQKFTSFQGHRIDLVVNKDICKSLAEGGADGVCSDTQSHKKNTAGAISRITDLRLIMFPFLPSV